MNISERLLPFKILAFVSVRVVVVVVIVVAMFSCSSLIFCFIFYRADTTDGVLFLIDGREAMFTPNESGEVSLNLISPLPSPLTDPSLPRFHSNLPFDVRRVLYQTKLFQQRGIWWEFVCLAVKIRRIPMNLREFMCCKT